MQSLSHLRHKKFLLGDYTPALRSGAQMAAMISSAIWFFGCAGAGGGSGPPPPPPPSIQVSVSPAAGTVLLGATQSFSATVTNATDTSVSWSVNGIAGGSAQTGTISSQGLYTAPADLPVNASIQISATSHQDPTKSGRAAVTLASDILVSLTPGAASVELGALQIFQAGFSSSGHPDPTIRWSISGAACPNSCGTVDSSGNYTAPQILPTSPSVTITATSAADSSKHSSATIRVISTFLLQLAAPGTVQPGVTAALVATLTPAANSKPSAVLNWSLSGTGCNGNACGILTVTTTQSAGGGSIANNANYTAPIVVPQPNTVTVTVTPLADPSKKVQATITIPSAAGISLSPLTATLAANHRITLAVTENGVSGSLNWTVNGVSGGNSIFGMICAVGSNPCQTVTSSGATQVDYVAPGAIPAPNPFSVAVTLAGNPVVNAATQITVINHVLVSVQPSTVTLPPLGVQGFTAAVLGSSNQSVTWQIRGAGCGTSGACGVINPVGAYTAPSTPPTPAQLQVVAISQDDASQSGTASITITSGASILSLHPASVYAGGLDGFTLLVDGSGFTPTIPGPGSVLVIAGTARITNCGDSNSCTAPVNAADVAQIANVTVQVQNPNRTFSNSVTLVVAAPNSGEDIVTLTSSTPSASGKDITVVEPTTAGEDTTATNLDLEVAALGLFVTASNTCNLAGNPVQLLRPASGSAAADICLFSQAGFDTSMTYSISGPGDVTVIAKQPAGLGIIHLTLQIPATAAPGARTLFIQNNNLDRTAASGVLEIQ